MSTPSVTAAPALPTLKEAVEAQSIVLWQVVSLLVAERQLPEDLEDDRARLICMARDKALAVVETFGGYI